MRQKVWKLKVKKAQEELEVAKNKYHMNGKSRDNFNKLLGKRVKLGRVIRGMSQSKVARGSNVTFQQIQKYEKGDNELSTWRLTRIAAILNTTIKWLLKPIKHRKEW